jgi:hypothetical protein
LIKNHNSYPEFVGQTTDVTRFSPAADPGCEPAAVLHLPGPANPSPSPVVAVPGLGLSVEVPARTLRRSQQVVESTVVALPGSACLPRSARR